MEPAFNNSKYNIYAWGCAGGIPVITSLASGPEDADPDGWLTRYWVSFTPGDQHAVFVANCGQSPHLCPWKPPPICALVPDACPLDLFVEPAN